MDALFCKPASCCSSSMPLRKGFNEPSSVRISLPLTDMQIDERNRLEVVERDNERHASQRDAASEALSAALVLMQDAIVRVTAATESHPSAENLDDACQGVVERSITEALATFGVTLQRYWNGTLVGNHCRKAILHWEELLNYIGTVIEMKHGNDKKKEFLTKHKPVWDALARIAEPMRTIKRLTDEQLRTLEVGCPAFANAYRDAFGKKVIPKIHIIEHHVYPFAKEFGSVGRFGEDGIESLHPIDNRARALVASMQNPEDRHRAMLNHIALHINTPDLNRKKRVRRNKIQLQKADDAIREEIKNANDIKEHNDLDVEIMRYAFGLKHHGMVLVHQPVAPPPNRDI